MTVELISVGTEILLGNIVNTNAAYLAEQCAALGLSCYYQTVVGDNPERLRETLILALKRSDIVILGGGLGPTQDDLTKEIAAEVMGYTLVEDAHTRERIASYLQIRGFEITENNWKQALVPEGCIVVDNENGTAPGLIMERDNKCAILLPGPPGEMIPMFEGEIYAYLDKLVPGTIFSKTVKICGIGESKAETMIRDLIDAQSNPTIATYAKTGEVHLRVTAMGENLKEAKQLVKPMVKELKERFAEAVYTTDENITLEKSVVDLLVAKQLSVVTAESCTGGLLAAHITDVPGASAMFKSSLVTYSNKAKRRLLGVRKSSLDKYGAVSEQVAKEMVKGVAAISKADVAVSITGIAGPDGGSPEKPVGTVFIGCSVCGEVIVREFHFKGNRKKIRENTVACALTIMREQILKYYSKDLFAKKNK